MADLDTDHISALLNIAKTIDESFPHLGSISAEAKEELKEINDEIKAERLKNTPRSARPGMPADQQESQVQTSDTEEVVRARAIPNKTTIADRRRA